MAAPAGIALLLRVKMVRTILGVAVGAVIFVIAAVAGLALLIFVVLSVPTSATAGPGAAVSALGWANPAVGKIVSPFGSRLKPCAVCSAFHEGDDIGAGCGKPIFAAKDGTVHSAGLAGEYGNLIVLDHEPGLETAYAHIVNGGLLVAIGQKVTAGQQIAMVGATGDATGCHLHFEVRVNGAQVDPVPILAAGGIAVGVG